MNPINLSIINTYLSEIDFPKFENHALPPLIISIDQKYIVNIIEKNNQIVLFSSCGKLDLENHKSDTIKNTNASVTWMPCKGMDERFNYKIVRHTASDLIILYSSADPSCLDTITFKAWIQEFIEQIKNWNSIVSQDAISAPIAQQQHHARENEMAAWA